VFKLNIGEAEVGDDLKTFVDLCFRQVKADKPAVGVGGRHRRNVAPGGTADLQNIGVSKIRGL